MQKADRVPFQSLLGDVMAFYRQDLSPFALTVWWQACEGFEFEQVAKALTAHAMDPERGQFAPKPADIVRQLQGTQTDRALLAWGKVYEAMQRVGAYRSVVFDDPAIHAAIEDMGGWPKTCRSTNDELPHVQRRFCDTYRAYARRIDFDFLPKLMGQHESENARLGHNSQPPLLLGDPERAKKVLATGKAQGRLAVTSLGTAADALRLGVTNAS